jgi:hypothetical protein
VGTGDCYRTDRGAEPVGVSLSAVHVLVEASGGPAALGEAPPVALLVAPPQVDESPGRAPDTQGKEQLEREDELEAVAPGVAQQDEAVGREEAVVDQQRVARVEDEHEGAGDEEQGSPGLVEEDAGAEGRKENEEAAVRVAARPVAALGAAVAVGAGDATTTAAAASAAADDDDDAAAATTTTAATADTAARFPHIPGAEPLPGPNPISEWLGASLPRRRLAGRVSTASGLAFPGAYRLCALDG